MLQSLGSHQHRHLPTTPQPHTAADSNSATRRPIWGIAAFKPRSLAQAGPNRWAQRRVWSPCLRQGGRAGVNGLKGHYLGRVRGRAQEGPQPTFAKQRLVQLVTWEGAATCHPHTGSQREKLGADAPGRWSPNHRHTSHPSESPLRARSPGLRSPQTAGTPLRSSARTGIGEIPEATPTPRDCPASHQIWLLFPDTHHTMCSATSSPQTLSAHAALIPCWSPGWASIPSISVCVWGGGTEAQRPKGGLPVPELGRKPRSPGATATPPELKAGAAPACGRSSADQAQRGGCREHITHADPQLSPAPSPYPPCTALLRSRDLSV